MFLFEGFLGCFSPSVSPHLRKIWVERGGTLTHSEADFKRANFFFCTGTEDKWLNELLSRSLIVRHASWVERCTEAEFLLPISPYTLDDLFDPSKIREQQVELGPVGNTSEALSTSNGARPNSETPAILGRQHHPGRVQEATHKRKREDMLDDSLDQADESRIQPPKKKKKRSSLELFKPVFDAPADVRAHAMVFPELYDSVGNPVRRSEQIRSNVGSTTIAFKEVDSDGRLNLAPLGKFKGVVKAESIRQDGVDRRGTVSMRSKFFENLRIKPCTVSKQAKQEESPTSPRLTEHAVFWNAMLSRSLNDDCSLYKVARHPSHALQPLGMRSSGEQDRKSMGIIGRSKAADSSAPEILTLSVEELISAPPVEATLFEVGKVWEGKAFVADRY